MPKKTQEQAPSLPHQLSDKLDFSATQKQVDSLMKNVLSHHTMHKNKLRFIQEQLHDQRYQINPKIIAHKMFEHVEDSDLTTVTDEITSL